MIIFQKNKKKFILAIILLIIMVLWTYFIFSMSMQTAEESSSVSRGLLKRLLTVIQNILWFDVEFQTLHNLFRKLAHFAEFFILGTLSAGFIKTMSFHILFSPAYCLIIAISDETIQYFTGEGRAAQLRDVLIDFSGSITGIITICLIVYIICKLKMNKKAKNEHTTQ